MWLKFLITRPVGVFTSVFVLTLLGLFVMLDKINIRILPELDVEKLMLTIEHDASTINSKELLIEVDFLVKELNRLDEVNNVVAVTHPYQTLIQISFIPKLRKGNRKINILQFIDNHWITRKLRIKKPYTYSGGIDGLPISYVAIKFPDDLHPFVQKQILQNEIFPTLQQLEETSIIDAADYKKQEIVITLKPEISYLFRHDIFLIEDQIRYLLAENKSAETRVGNNINTIVFEGIEKNLNALKNASIIWKNNQYFLHELADVSVKDVLNPQFISSLDNKEIFLIKIFNGNIDLLKSQRKVNEVLDFFKSKYNFEIITFENNGLILEESLGNVKLAILTAFLITILLIAIMYNNKYLILINGVFLFVAAAISNLILFVLGIEFNLISLLSIFLVIGILIDFSIVVIERCTTDVDKINIPTILKKVKDVEHGLWGAMVTNFIVFLPFAFLPNKLGFFVQELVIVLFVYLIVAIVCSITVLPMLVHMFRNKLPIKSQSQFKPPQISGFALIFVIIGIISTIIFTFYIKREHFPPIPYKGFWVYSNQEKLNYTHVEHISKSLIKGIYISENSANFRTSNLNQFAFQYWSFIQFEEYTSLAHVQEMFKNYNAIIVPETNPFIEIFEENFLQSRANFISKDDLSNQNSNLIQPYTLNKSLFVPKPNDEFSIHFQKKYISYCHDGEEVGKITYANELTPIKIRFYPDHINNNNNNNLTNNNLSNNNLSNNNLTNNNLSNNILKGYSFDNLYTETMEKLYYPILTNNNTQNTFVLDKNMAEADSTTEFENILLYMVIAFILIYFVILIQFESFRISSSLVSTIIISIFGGVFGIFVTGISFNFMSLLGLFLTIGVGINDGILKAEGVKYFLKIGYTLNNAIASSSATRFRPILFTTLTTTLGLTPIFFQSQSLSKIIFLNFSIPVIFGVITSTLYTILFLNSSLKWAFLEEYKK